MPDDSDPDSTPLWIDRGSTEDAVRNRPDIEVIPDENSETVTFAWRPNEDQATTAWITADANRLVDVADMQ